MGDLREAEDEARRIAGLFRHSYDRTQVKVFGYGSNPVEVVYSLRRCDILHFAGHVVVPKTERDSDKCGWLLGGRIRERKTWYLLRPDDLYSLWAHEEPPYLVFANGCRSAMRPLKPRNGKAAMDLAQSFLAAGVAAYVGAVWDAPDDEANPKTSQFAESFYRQILGGRNVSDAMLEVRREVHDRYGREALTWAQYVLCGDPFLRLPFEPEQTQE